jgi:hypothetical protein
MLSAGDPLENAPVHVDDAAMEHAPGYEPQFRAAAFEARGSWSGAKVSSATGWKDGDPPHEGMRAGTLPRDRSDPADELSQAQGDPPGTYRVTSAKALNLFSKARKLLDYPKSKWHDMRDLCTTAVEEQVLRRSQDASFAAQLEQWEASKTRRQLPEAVTRTLLRKLSSFAHRHYIPQINSTVGRILYPHEDMPHKMRRVVAGIRTHGAVVRKAFLAACRVARAANLPDPSIGDVARTCGRCLFPWHLLSEAADVAIFPMIRKVLDGTSDDQCSASESQIFSDTDFHAKLRELGHDHVALALEVFNGAFDVIDKGKFTRVQRSAAAERFFALHDASRRRSESSSGKARTTGCTWCRSEQRPAPSST